MFKEKIECLGEFEFYDDYFIGRVDKGVNAGDDFLDTLTNTVQKYYLGRPIAYISDKVNSYSLDTFAASKLISRNNIRFAAFVTYTYMQKKVYPLEERYIQGAELRSFRNLDAAAQWVMQKLPELN